jgi:hypothetical protein
MNEAKTYSIGVEDEDIVIRVNATLVDHDALAKLLDYVELESIRRRSRLTEEQAAALADQIKRDVWQSARERYVEE